MIIQKHVAEVTFHHSAKGTVHNNPELKRCMYAHLANDAKVGVSFVPHLMLLISGTS